MDGLLHPHSSIPYVQMGRSIALYTVSLLSRDSCERGIFWLLCASSTLVFRLGEFLSILLLF